MEKEHLKRQTCELDKCVFWAQVESRPWALCGDPGEKLSLSTSAGEDVG